MGEMAIMDRDAGDLKVIWDPESNDEVAAARAQFDTLTKKGYLAYKTRRGGGKGTQIRSFDPEAEAIILAPPLVGG